MVMLLMLFNFGSWRATRCTSGVLHCFLRQQITHVVTLYKQTGGLENAIRIGTMLHCYPQLDYRLAIKLGGLLKPWFTGYMIYDTRWWFQFFLIFIPTWPYLGKIPNLTNMFQRGWNHQIGSSGNGNFAFTRTPLVLKPCCLVGWAHTLAPEAWFFRIPGGSSHDLQVVHKHSESVPLSRVRPSLVINGVSNPPKNPLSFTT